MPVTFEVEVGVLARAEGDALDAMAAAAWRTLQSHRAAMRGSPPPFDWATQEEQEKAIIRAALEAARWEGYRGCQADARLLKGAW